MDDFEITQVRQENGFFVIRLETVNEKWEVIETRWLAQSLFDFDWVSNPAKATHYFKRQSPESIVKLEVFYRCGKV